MVCQFLLYNKVNQLYIYIHPHISSLLHVIFLTKIKCELTIACVSLTPIESLLKLFKVILFPTYTNNSPHTCLNILLNIYIPCYIHIYTSCYIIQPIYIVLWVYIYTQTYMGAYAQTQIHTHIHQVLSFYLTCFSSE